MLASLEAKIIAGAAALALIGGAIWLVYHKGESAGSSSVRVEVQRKTIETLDAARLSREKTDAEVHSTPYRDRVDGLR